MSEDRTTEISDWADITHQDDDNPRGGTCIATEREHGTEVGRLSYYFLHDDENIQFKEIRIHPDYQRKRVATALLRYLNYCHPNARINPGVRNPVGQLFMDHILATEGDKVATNGILNVPLQNQTPAGFGWGGTSAPGT
jgi:GNAT superfamily N-acetyltransferase